MEIVVLRLEATFESSGVVATTAAVSLSSSGDAEIDDLITLPSTCVGPIVLIRVGGTTTSPPPILGPWIAATGF